MERRLYGTGGLWLRKSKRYPEGQFWIRYYDNAGRQRAENANTDNEAKALKLLAKRVGEAQAGTLPSPQAKRTLVEDLATAYFKAARAAVGRKIPENLPEPTRQWRSLRAEKVIEGQQQRWDKHVAPVFAHLKAALVTKQDIDDYVAARLKAGARHATINREVALLKRMYRLGHESRPRLVTDMPQFPTRLPETSRTGYIEDASFKKLLAAIEEPGLKAMTLTAYRLGFRKGELQNLLVMQFSNGWLKLFAGATKNGKARAVFLPKDVRAALEKCAKGKAPDAYLFTWANGDRILDFRGAWAKATAAAGLPKLLFHDLRRSAVRRMLRKGVPVATAMKISGHLTRQVFDQYDVSGESDLVDASKIL